MNFTEKEYKKFYSKIEKIHDDKLNKFKIELHSRQASLSNVTKKIIDIDKDSIVWSVNNDEIFKLQEAENIHKTEIKNLKEKISSNEVVRVSLDEFLNTSKNASLIVKRGDVVQKD